MLEKLATDPRFFIGHRTKYRGAQTQAYIAIVVGLAFALQHVGTYLQLDDVVAASYYEVILISVAIELLIPFAVWLAATALVVLVARFWVGRFTVGYVFRLLGWGLAPLVAGGLVLSAGRLYALRDEPAPELGTFTHISHAWEQYRAYIDVATTDPVFVAATVLAISSVLYTWHVWSLVVDELGAFENLDVRTWQARIIAAVPALLCLGWVSAPFLL